MRITRKGAKEPQGIARIIGRAPRIKYDPDLVLQVNTRCNGRLRRVLLPRCGPILLADHPPDEQRMMRTARALGAKPCDCENARNMLCDYLRTRVAGNGIHRALNRHLTLVHHFAAARDRRAKPRDASARLATTAATLRGTRRSMRIQGAWDVEGKCYVALRLWMSAVGEELHYDPDLINGNNDYPPPMLRPALSVRRKTPQHTWTFNAYTSAVPLSSLRAQSLGLGRIMSPDMSEHMFGFAVLQQSFDCKRYLMWVVRKETLTTSDGVAHVMFVTRGAIVEHVAQGVGRIVRWADAEALARNAVDWNA